MRAITRSRPWAALAAVATFALILAACSGDEGEATTTAGGVTSLEDVRNAVVRIVAEGTFIDPDFGEQLNAAGSGSGFIISASGLAVTNNHVVTGAGLVRVFIEGRDQPVNARLLGASECSDLAVIDLAGDGYTFLVLREGSVDAGLDAYAAGFPLGDPEYTLTRGIVSKARADGESEWASVDSVIEHDAQINPGSSGGPLVDSNGAVIGINYAGSDATNQSFAIGLAELRRIIDRLSAGEHVTSIGVNGQAVSTFDADGIWVASVRSGSPADRAGIRAADIITRLEGLVLGADGTMSDYCDILRSHGPDDVLAFEILRTSTGQLLEGRLNGDTALVDSFSFADRLSGSFTGSGSTDYIEFYSVSDDSGALEVDVPAQWTQIDGTPWFTDEPFAPSITVAADLDAYLNSWTEPGLFFGVSQELAQFTGVDGLLDRVDENIGLSAACSWVGRFDYSDSFYTGKFDQFEGCGGDDVIYISLAALPEDGRFIISVQVQLQAQQDASVLDSVLDSFIVLDAPPLTATSTPTPPTRTPTPTPPRSYREVSDDSGNLFVEVPAEWTEVDGTSWDPDEAFAPSIVVATDLTAFNEAPTEPGLFFGVSQELAELMSVEAWLDAISEGFVLDQSCDFVGRFPYSDSLYSGRYDRFERCGEVDVITTSLVALPEDGSFMIWITVVLDAREDERVLDRILNSFIVRDTAPTTPPGASHEVTDDSETLFVDVPAGWTEVDGESWFPDEAFAPSLVVTADRAAFDDTLTEPGLIFAVSAELAQSTTVDGWLETMGETFVEMDCEFAGRVPYSDVFYSGLYDRFEGCYGTDSIVISLAALPDDGSYLIWLLIQLGEQDDDDLLNLILDSFIVLD